MGYRRLSFVRILCLMEVFPIRVDQIMAALESFA